MNEAWRALLRDAPELTLVMLGAAALAILCGGGAIARSRAQRVLSTSSLGALGALVVALVSLVHGSRADMLAVMRGSALPADRAARLLAAIDVQLGALFVGSLAIAVAAPIAILAAALPSRRPAVVIAAAGVSLGVTAAALACAAYAYEIGVGISALADADAGARGELSRALFERAESRLDLGRVALVVSTALSALAAWDRAARRGAAVRARAWIGAVSIFVAGAVAFAATRDLAHDADHPLASGGIPSIPSLPELDLPELERCTDRPLELAPTLVLHRGIALLDGRPIESPDALAMEARRAGALYVECDAATPLAEVTPWLRAAHRRGDDAVYVIGQRVSRVVSRTLGPQVQRERCDAVLALDPEGQPLGRYASWAALARAAVRASGDLRVAP